MRDAKVQELGDGSSLGIERQQHVVRLQVPMHNPARMGVCECRKHLVEDLDERLAVRWLTPPLTECPTRYQLHRHEVATLMGAEIHELRDIRMNQASRRARLSQKSTTNLGLLEQILPNHLQGQHGTFFGCDPVHLAHSARAQKLMDPVGSDRLGPGVRGECGWRAGQWITAR